MKRYLFALFALFACCAATSPAQPNPGPISVWNPAQIAVLRHWVAAAGEDALPVPAVTELDHAVAGADKATIDRAATALALRLARMHLLGSVAPGERRGWHLVDSDTRIDLPARLAQALGAPEPDSAAALNRFFDGLRPEDPEYAALRAAFATEQDPARRATLALNMERWRWLPVSLGRDHILVNAARFEVGLWRQGKRVGVWPVVVGKPKSPTPAFQATVTGVTVNPWWDIPGNIVRESIGALMRRHPHLARQRGYVRVGGRYRQGPGPANSLGRMKLVMPNPFDIYLHDTPEQKLFDHDVRAFSHGCIRVKDALGFATMVLQGVKTREEVDAIVAGGQTTTIGLAQPIPVYVTYFTASTRDDGTLAIVPDIYGRDSDSVPKK